MIDFEKYHVSEISKDLVENYINQKRQKTPRLAKIYSCLLEQY